jgi:glutamyl-tRNA synthetase
MKYGHISPINKLEDDGGKRKLSKRKDPEANVEYYQKAGYPNVAIIEYLMNLANSEFEDWRKANVEKPYTEFQITFKKLSQSTGPLFNEIKLRDISKQVISKMNIQELYSNLLEWSFKYDKEFNEKLTNNKDYWLKIIGIERGSEKRKDIAVWSEVYEFYKFFDTETFIAPLWDIFATPLTQDEIKQIRQEVAKNLNTLITPDDFMNLMRTLAKRFNLAENIKEFKASQGKMRGHVGLVSQVVRYAVTGRTNTPDLFQIIQVLGIKETEKRLIS